MFEFDHQLMNMFEFVRSSKDDDRVCVMFVRIVFDPSLGLRNQAMFKVKEFLVQKISK